MDELYNKEILRLAASLREPAPLDAPDARAAKTSRICGSRVAIEVTFEKGRVKAYSQEVKACALGQASAALMQDLAIGKTANDIAEAGAALEDLLKNGGMGPIGEWAAYQVFRPARHHPGRHSAILLPFKALEEAFKSV